MIARCSVNDPLHTNMHPSIFARSTHADNGHYFRRSFSTLKLLQHRLQVVCDLERRLGFALDFIYRDTIRNLNKRQTLCKINIKHTLWPSVSNLMHFSSSLFIEREGGEGS